MDVIRHHHIGMQPVVRKPRLTLLKRGNQQTGDFRPLERKGTSLWAVQEAIHGDERLPIISHTNRRKDAI